MLVSSQGCMQLKTTDQQCSAEDTAICDQPPTNLLISEEAIQFEAR